MKEPIENLLKQSLEGHDMPYRPEAWSAMEARLDAISPAQAPRSNFRYYIAAAAGLGLTAVAAYFILAYNGVTEDTAQPQLVQNETTSSESANKEMSSTTEDNNSSTVNTDNSTPESNGSSTNENPTNLNPEVNPVNNHGIVSTPGNSNNPVTVNNDPNKPIGNLGVAGTVLEPLTQTPAVMSQESITIPTVPNLCMNEEFSIENTNDRTIVILQPDGRNYGIEGGKTVNYIPSMKGIHSIGYMTDAEFHSENTFTVNSAPEVDFTIDFINKFETGIPTTHVEAGSMGGTYTWKAKNQSAQGQEADFHFYRKGQQSIFLTTSDGICSSTVEKTFYVEEDYNLMAVNSFSPSDNDPRKSTFIPFALTQRNINFKMMIFDSKDGGVVYETTDSTLPWDGTDKRTGKRDTDIATYIWKVVLMNPDRNEPAEYIGTITKL